MKLWGVIDCAMSCAMLWLGGKMPKKWMTIILASAAFGLMFLGGCLILDSFV